jgi:hypothetical protein
MHEHSRVSEDMLTIYIMHRRSFYSSISGSFNCLRAWPSCVTTTLEVLWRHKWLIIWDGCKGVPWCSSPGIVSNSSLIIAWKQINSSRVKITQPLKNGRLFQSFVGCDNWAQVPLAHLNKLRYQTLRTGKFCFKGMGALFPYECHWRKNSIQKCQISVLVRINKWSNC